MTNFEALSNFFQGQVDEMKGHAEFFAKLAEACEAAKSLPTVEQLVAEARRQALEEAARFICLNVQVLSSHEDHPAYWSARRNGNAYALEYAAAIRALKDSPPPPTV